MGLQRYHKGKGAAAAACTVTAMRVALSLQAPTRFRRSSRSSHFVHAAPVNSRASRREVAKFFWTLKLMHALQTPGWARKQPRLFIC